MQTDVLPLHIFKPPGQSATREDTAFR